jgi:hypothetical protein
MVRARVGRVWRVKAAREPWLLGVSLLFGLYLVFGVFFRYQILFSVSWNWCRAVRLEVLLGLSLLEVWRLVWWLAGGYFLLRAVGIAIERRDRANDGTPALVGRALTSLALTATCVYLAASHWEPDDPRWRPDSSAVEPGVPAWELVDREPDWVAELAVKDGGVYVVSRWSERSCRELVASINETICRESGRALQRQLRAFIPSRDAWRTAHRCGAVMVLERRAMQESRAFAPGARCWLLWRVPIESVLRSAPQEHRETLRRALENTP